MRSESGSNRDFDFATGAQAMKHRRMIVIVCLMTLMIAACTARHEAAGNNDSAGAAQATDQKPAVAAATADAPILDACALISQADADAVLGTPGKLSAHVEDNEFTSHCSYESVDASNGPNTLGVTISTGLDATSAKSGFEREKKMYSDVAQYDSQVLPGIGEDAFLAENRSPQGADSGVQQQILGLAKGSKEIKIIVSYFGKQRSTDAVKALAKNLADKI
jgi:hypothetical protein